MELFSGSQLFHLSNYNVIRDVSSSFGLFFRGEGWGDFLLKYPTFAHSDCLNWDLHLTVYNHSI